MCIRDRSLSGEIEDLIDWKPVRAGDYFYIPAGTVHAIGAGITLVEVQQYADVTYRLFDYGRPRELHLDDGVAVSRAEPYGDPRSGHIAPDVYLADGPVFWLRSLATRSYSRSDFASGRCWLIPVQGKVYCDDQVVEIGECMVTSAFDAIIVDDAAICLIAGA